MYKLRDSFLEFNIYSELEEELLAGHRENIEDFLKCEDVIFEDLQGNCGYAYCDGLLVTFSESINYMVEYKVWEDL